MRFERRSVVRSRRLARSALPDLIELIVIGVRGGLTPASALEAAGPHLPADLAQAVAAVRHEMHRGCRLADALEALPAWLGSDARELTEALATADRYGLPLEPALDRLCADVRSARRRAAQEAARTLPVKLSFPLVLCTLPSFVLLAVAPAILGAVSTVTGLSP